MIELLGRADLWVVFAYLAAMLVIAFRVSSGSRDVEGYTVGNRQLSGTVVGLSVLGTFLSSITFLGLPAKTYQADWNAFVFGLALPLAALVATRYFVPLYRSQIKLSAYEFLEQRLGAWARWYADVSYLLLQLIRVGTVLLLVGFAVEPMLALAPDATAAKMMPSTTGVDVHRMAVILVALGALVIVYDTLGGIRAVIWTDVVQVLVLLVGGLWCLSALVLGWRGGVGDFFASLPVEKMSLGPWTNLDPDSGIWNWAIPSVAVVLLYGFTENLRNYGTDQNYVQRTLSARSDREAAKSIWIGAWSYLPLSIIFCLIGTGLWMTAHGQTGGSLPEGLTADQVFPYFIRHCLPAPVAGLVIAAILAAAMSTVDSSLNSCSTVLLADVLRPLRIVPRRVPEIIVIRLCTVLFGIVGTLAAVVLLLVKGQHESKVLMDLWWQYAGTAGGGMFGLFLLAWLMPRVPGWCAAAGVALSIPALVWGTFARDITSDQWRWLECPLHPFLVGVLGTCVILLVGALCLLAVRAGLLPPNRRPGTETGMLSAHADVVGDLPEHLLERTRGVGAAGGRPTGKFVLYWLHHAMRAHENPALDVAVTAANHLGLPILVYQAVSERYPHASDRHHTFMLEGARDLQGQFRERGIGYVFHLERRHHRGPHLRELADRAALVFTEEVPVDPLRAWTDRLASTTQTPVFCVDTACVAPMQLVGGAYTRAFQFRKATRPLYDERLHRAWGDVQPNLAAQVPDLPFEPLDLSSIDLAELVGQCEIDHAIGPIPHTRGGSAAGYARWNGFKESGLDVYDKRRNNPLIDGTSRLSPYLHYGMVSPLRIAREAAESESKGAEKYLDELLIWRELAYSFCFYRPKHGTLAALPVWARESLAEHESDIRPAVYSWETLARGTTDDKLWDAAQRSLLIHGELHNNVRMTWGKALLNWTPDAESGLAAMIDLNHRYALDGRDPASYGGILWCLGQFDRPFPPARPIFGTVRDRSTKEHANRLDPDRYFKHTTRPLCEPIPRVTVVGAGISGLMCARTLFDHGIDVTVFEKSRGVGGRMATRRTAEGPRFDHGAQYFTVRDARFQRYAESWMRDGIVAPWEGRICTLTNGHFQWKQETTPRYVGAPGMNAICRHLATDLNVRLRTQVRPPEFEQGIWHLSDEQGEQLGQFDCVIISAPAPQSAGLLAAAPDLQQQARSTKMHGCWAAMLSFDRSLELPFAGAFVHDSPLSWTARNDSKPQRGGGHESWVLHASPEWSDRCLEEDPDDVLPKLVDAFWQASGAKPRKPSYAAAHRWRYAIPPQPLDDRCLFDADLRFGACGDWCSGPRVEGAFLSGMAMAGRVLAQVEALARGEAGASNECAV